jgi:hypothetical protein
MRRDGGRLAGFGKTALLSDRARRGRRPCLQPLDEAGNDPAAFWRHARKRRSSS